MSRSGYTDDYCDNQWDMIRWRGAVNSAIKGSRGQAFLKEMLAALDTLPEPILIKDDLEKVGKVCAIGAVGQARGIDMSKLDPEDRYSVGHTFGIAPALASEIVYMNDEWIYYRDDETPEARFTRMRQWIISLIKPEPGELK